jgi:hypothetical protein
VTAEFVIGAYHQLFQIEKSFRMAKSDLQARPIYHRKRDSIEAHLTIVLAALAVSRWLEHQTGRLDLAGSRAAGQPQPGARRHTCEQPVKTSRPQPQASAALLPGLPDGRLPRRHPAWMRSCTTCRTALSAGQRQGCPACGLPDLGRTGCRASLHVPSRHPEVIML